MSTTLQLLKAKRSSAVKDARKIEAQLARLSCIVRMFGEYIATLDEAIRSAHPARRQKHNGLSA